MKQSSKTITPHWWTLPSDEDEETPVQFHIRPLDGFAATDVAMMTLSARATNTVASRSGNEVIKYAFRHGVIGWKNIEDADNPGQPLTFSQAAMSKLEPAWIMETGAHVLEISSLGAGDSKN